MPGRRTLLTGLVVLALLAATAAASYLAYDSERDAAMDADLELSERVAAEARANVVSVASGLRGAWGSSTRMEASTRSAFGRSRAK